MSLTDRDQGAASAPAFARVRTWTPELDQEVFGGLLADLEEGYSKRVAFVVPRDVAWPLPAYELAQLSNRRDERFDRVGRARGKTGNSRDDFQRVPERQPMRQRKRRSH